MSTFHVTLQTPTAVFYNGEAEALRLKTDLGRMEILPNHATFLGTILYSKVYVRHGNTEEKFIIRQGSVSVDEEGKATVLANDVQKEEELSISNMKDYLEYLTQQLSDESTLNEYQRQFLQEQREAIEGSLNGNQE